MSLPGNQPVGQVGHRDHHHHGKEGAVRGQHQVPSEMGGGTGEQMPRWRGQRRACGSGRGRPAADGPPCGPLVSDRRHRRPRLPPWPLRPLPPGGPRSRPYQRCAHHRAPMSRTPPAARPGGARRRAGSVRPPAVRPDRALLRSGARRRQCRPRGERPPQATYRTGPAERGTLGPQVRVGRYRAVRPASTRIELAVARHSRPNPGRTAGGPPAPAERPGRRVQLGAGS